MSNARSPREVCSTTIGTSGLTVLASFCVSASIPATGLRPWLERPAAALGASLARSGAVGVGFGALGRLVLDLGVEPAPLLGLFDRDRLGRLGDEVERLALREVVLERLDPAAGLQALHQLLGRDAARTVAGGLLHRLEDLAV